MSSFTLVQFVYLAALFFTRASTTDSKSQQICYTVQAQGPSPDQVSGYVVYPPQPVVFQLPTTVDPTKRAEPSPKSTETRCKWKLVLKAVSGNGRDIYVDWAQGSARNDNERVPEAREIQSDKIFRASSILDTWDQRDIDRVRLEVYKGGVQKTWLLFNGVATDMNSWMTQDRLIASPYNDIKTGSYNFFSALGDDRTGVKRRFLINRSYLGCPKDCGYLMVTSPLPTYRCPYESVEKAPAFYYSLKSGCGLWTHAGERGSGDRLVISVRECELDTPTK